MTEACRTVWRMGVAPLLSLEQLQALRQGLAADDPCLLQGLTCDPPHYHASDWPAQACCALAYAAWRADPDINTVDEVEKWFAKMCGAIDKRLAEPAAC